MDPSAGIPEAVKQRIDTIAGKYVGQPKTAGLAVGIYYRGVTRVLTYGALSKDRASPPDGDTLFEIASITKVFTTLLLADMAGRGEVELDDPIQKYLPPEVKAPGHPEAPITLRHLATHTSGLPRLPDNLESAELDPENPYAHYTEEALLAFLSGCRPRRKPGRINEYSNLGTGLLGYLLARRAGTRYEELLREQVLAPLGMRDIAVALPPELAARLAPPHADGKPVPPWDVSVLAGAGGLRSSTNDMLRFLAAQLGHGGEPLRTAIEQTHRQQFGSRIALSALYYLGRTALAFVLAATLSYNLLSGAHTFIQIAAAVIGWLVLENVLGSWLDGRLQPIALGWHLAGMSGASEPVLWHNGGTGGSRSYLAFSREKDVGVVLLANSDQELDPAGNEVLTALLQS